MNFSLMRKYVIIANSFFFLNCILLQIHEMMFSYFMPVCACVHFEMHCARGSQMKSFSYVLIVRFSSFQLSSSCAWVSCEGRIFYLHAPCVRKISCVLA